MHSLYLMVIVLVLKSSTANDDCTPEVVENRVEFFLYTKQTEFQIDTNDEQTVLNAPLAESTNKVVFVIHGYSETHTTRSMEAIRSAYMSKEEDCNVIMVDYSSIVNTAVGYVKSVSALPEISTSIATCIELLKKLRPAITNYHVIGFSLGAQMACKVGTMLKNKDMKLDRVTALDAAKPLFSGDRNEVNPDCANFVDAYHSNTDVIALSEPIGTADIYINDGQNQPECYKKIGLIDFCNHITVVFLYAASITDGDKFKATYCLDYKVNCNADDKYGRLYNVYAQEDFKAISVICSINDKTTYTVAVGDNIPLDSKGVYQLIFKEYLPGVRAIFQ